MEQLLKTDCTTSQRSAQVECLIVAIEEQEVTLKTALTVTLYFYNALASTRV